MEPSSDPTPGALSPMSRHGGLRARTPQGGLRASLCCKTSSDHLDIIQVQAVEKKIITQYGELFIRKTRAHVSYIYTRVCRYGTRNIILRLWSVRGTPKRTNDGGGGVLSSAEVTDVIGHEHNGGRDTGSVQGPAQA